MIQILTGTALLLVVLLAIGISAIAVTVTKKGDKVNTITTGNISLDYTEDTNGITITNAMPLTDAVGKKLSGTDQYFDFSVISTITGQANITYEISALKLAKSTLDDKNVKLYLEKKESGTYKECNIFLQPDIFQQCILSKYQLSGRKHLWH